MIAIMASGDLPTECAFLATCGRMFALNKLDHEEQEERTLTGLKPKVRPVNIGVVPTKWAFKMALMQPAPRKAMKVLESNGHTNGPCGTLRCTPNNQPVPR